MSSNDDTVESDEHEEEQEEIDDQEIESEAEQGEPDEDNGISDQEGSNPENLHQGDDDDEEGVNESPVRDDEMESRDAVDPTNPLDEDSVEAAQNLTQEDVFGGELSDLSEDEGGIRRKSQSVRDFSDHQEGQDGDEDKLNDEEDEEEEEEEQIIVDTPYVSCDLGRDIHLVKLPSFMKVEPKPFDAQYFNEEIQDDDDEESRARKKLALENTIRWRYGTSEHGETMRESNTRLVRWSDGSLSLHVGKEIFDVSKANIQSDHNHLFVRHQKSMQAQAVFRTKLSFRQHSNDSLAHLKLKFASKANPAPKVRVLSNIKEATNSADLKRKEEQRLKAERRRRNQQSRQSERATDRDQKMSASYLEDRFEQNEDNDQESLNAIKKQVKKKRLQGGYQAEGSSDDDEDDDPSEKLISQRSSTSTRHRTINSSDEDESDNEQQTKRKRVQSAGDDDDE